MNIACIYLDDDNYYADKYFNKIIVNIEKQT